MLMTLKTLLTGSSARAEDRVRDAFALELIDQKIRETETQLRAAKATLAQMIQRQRSENRLYDGLQNRIASLPPRAREALEADRDDLANEAAQAIATMENESTLRRETIDRLEIQVTRLRASVEVGHRRIIDLRQGAISARAIRREQDIQSRFHSTQSGPSSADEAQELIAQVSAKDDPFERGQILADINADLSHSGIEDRMAAQGFGPATKTTASDVLRRLKP